MALNTRSACGRKMQTQTQRSGRATQKKLKQTAERDKRFVHARRMLSALRSFMGFSFEHPAVFCEGWKKEMEPIINTALYRDTKKGMQTILLCINTFLWAELRISVATKDTRRVLAFFDNAHTTANIALPARLRSAQQVLSVHTWQRQLQTLVDRDAILAVFCQDVIRYLLYATIPSSNPTARKCNRRSLLLHTILMMWNTIFSAKMNLPRTSAVLWPSVCFIMMNHSHAWHPWSLNHIPNWMQIMWARPWLEHESGRHSVARVTPGAQNDPAPIREGVWGEGRSQTLAIAAAECFQSHSEPRHVADYLQKARKLRSERSRRRREHVACIVEAKGHALFGGRSVHAQSWRQRQAVVCEKGIAWTAHASGVPWAPLSAKTNAASSAFYLLIPHAIRQHMYVYADDSQDLFRQNIAISPRRLRCCVLVHILLEVVRWNTLPLHMSDASIPSHALLRTASGLRMITARFKHGARSRRTDMSTKQSIHTLRRDGWLPPFVSATVNRIQSSKGTRSLWKALHCMMSPWFRTAVPDEWLKLGVSVSHRWAHSSLAPGGRMSAVVLHKPVRNTWTLSTLNAPRAHRAIRWLSRLFPALVATQLRSVAGPGSTEWLQGSEEQVHIVQLSTPIVVMAQQAEVLSLFADGKTTCDICSSPMSIAPLLSFACLWVTPQNRNPMVLGCLFLLHHAWVQQRPVHIVSTSLGSSLFVPSHHGRGVATAWGRVVRTVLCNGCFSLGVLDSLAQTQTWHTCRRDVLVRVSNECIKLWSHLDHEVMRWGEHFGVSATNDLHVASLTPFPFNAVLWLPPSSTRRVWFMIAVVLEFTDAGAPDTRQAAWNAAMHLRCSTWKGHRHDVPLSKLCPPWQDSSQAYYRLAMLMSAIEARVYEHAECLRECDIPTADPEEGTHDPFITMKHPQLGPSSELTPVPTDAMLLFVDNAPDAVTRVLLTASLTIGQDVETLDSMYTRVLNPSFK